MLSLFQRIEALQRQGAVEDRRNAYSKRNPLHGQVSSERSVSRAILCAWERIGMLYGRPSQKAVAVNRRVF